MKVAVTGKGGVGKTTVTAALSRLLARAGNPVVAVDADPNPNLGIALGLGAERTESLDGVVNLLMRERAAAAVPNHSHDGEQGQGHTHPETPERDAESLLAELGAVAPDGVRLLQTGRIERPAEGCLCCGSHRATREIFAELSGERRVVLADLEAGVTDLCWTDPKPDDAVIVVVTPDRNSIEVARRALQVTIDLDVGRVLVVANRVAPGDDDAASLRDLLPWTTAVEIPEDPAVTEAERQGLSPLDLAPDAPAVQAVADLASQLLSR
jgi:CO dehydrogenase maturation factor